jgi:hypothetical protein
MFAGTTSKDRASIQNFAATPRLFIVWTLFAVFCQCVGWTLSAFGALNAAGYAVAFLLFFAAIAGWLMRSGAIPKLPNFNALKRRFKHPFPLGFLILTTLAILGGVLYSPNNFDGNGYRTPRVLEWLAEGRWHWIHIDYGSFNTRTAGFEWVTAPLLAFAKTDRFDFLINVVCFLFLPGRIFAVLTRLGIHSRVAYHWMWIYPTGYGFLVQAGSIGNDLFATLWPLAALEFALRARQTNREEYVWLSAFAAALMTASKAFNLLLLPAWGIAIFPALRLWLRRPFASIAVALAIAVASMIPTAALNLKYCGDWTGLAAEPVKLTGGPPLFQISVNLVLVLLSNFTPPVFPFTATWDRFVSHWMPSRFATQLDQYFEGASAHFRMNELQSEEWAGLGFGISVLLLTILAAHVKRGGKTPSFRSLLSIRNLIAIAALGGAIIFMARSGLSAEARYLLPFYIPMTVPLLSLPVAMDLLRSKAWRRLTLAMFFLAAVLVILIPARPLWPALTILGNANRNSSSALQRAAVVYSVYRERADVLGPIRQALPANARIIGLLADDYPETALWRPFGTRRVLYIRAKDSPEFTRSRGFEYVVIGPSYYLKQLNMSADDWIRKNHAEIVGEFSIKARAGAPPVRWILVRLKSD